MLTTSARLLRLLALLQSRKHWSGEELSERLEVADRTLRRDVERLRALGYSVEAAAGKGGGYQLGRGPQLPPLLLSDDEAVALAVALASAADVFDGVAENALAVLVKIDQLLPPRLRKRTSALRAVTTSMDGGARIDAGVLATLAQACRDLEQLTFSYETHLGTSSVRHVEPLRLARTGNRRWYLVAWDLERDDWRTFRVDRIRTPQSGARFSPRDPPADFEQFVARSLSAAPYRLQGRVRLRGSAAQAALRVPPWVGALEPEGEESCVLVTGADSWDALVCQVVLSGADFEVIGPPELRDAVERVAARLHRAVT